MAFASYNAFRTSMIQLLVGDDTSDPGFSLNTADLLIALGEARVYNGDQAAPGLRASCMVKPLSQTLTSNVAALPADVLELKELYFSGHKPLEIIPLNRMRALILDGSHTGNAAYAAQDGDNLTFWPSASGTVIGSYYKRPAALKTVVWTDALEIARYPELFIYACLIESAPFLGFDERMQMWQEQYRLKANGAMQAEQWRVYGGSPLRIRAR